ncbi:MAG: tetratricopeptide repeat protein [Lawsonella sp.]
MSTEDYPDTPQQPTENMAGEDTPTTSPQQRPESPVEPPIPSRPTTSGSVFSGPVTTGSIMTEAVPFNPFDDDEDDLTDSELIAAAFPSGAVSYPQPEDIPTQPESKPVGEAPPETSPTEPINPANGFRSGRRVADGLVTIPYIIPYTPTDALFSREKVEAVCGQKGVELPSLKPGDWVGDQYEIKGVIAYGGMGWIYLGIDHNVSDRWVVFKGLLDAKHKQSREVALAEKEFLAEVTHPGIVNIYNFVVDHDGEDYIVMEYVGGPSLRTVRNSKPGKVLDVALAIGYILEVLPALDHLHSMGLAYNDLKPENIMLTEDQVKLIDLGAVSPIGEYGYIYGTPGFQAPEIPTSGPSIASDIYTVGRTLASLIMRLPQEDGHYKRGIPSPEEEPLMHQHDNLYRLLRRATHPNPRKRFSSANDMSIQLMGVLREILSERYKEELPFLSTQFTPQRKTFGITKEVARTDFLWDGRMHDFNLRETSLARALPMTLVDPDDPGIKIMSAFSYAAPEDVIERLTRVMEDPESPARHSAEIPLAIVRAYVQLEQPRRAKDYLAQARGRIMDWRYDWYQGITSLLVKDFRDAYEHFDKVLNSLPGETGPKLALGATAELIVQSEPEMSPAEVEEWQAIARSYYRTCWRCNHTTVTAGFGLARQLNQIGQVDEAIETLSELLSNNRHYPTAVLTMVLMQVRRPPTQLTEEALVEAAERLMQLSTNEQRYRQVRVVVLEAALRWLRYHKLERAEQQKTIFNLEFSRIGIRGGLERSLRILARNAPSRAHRYRLVDMANIMRPPSMF